MKKLVKLFLVSILGVILTVGVASCSDDKYSLGDFWVSWATINEGDNSFTLDDSTTLYIAATATNYQPKNKRVIINYTILSDSYAGYDHAIKLNGYVADVLTKNIFYLNPNDKVAQDSIGNDPVNIKAIWEGGGYLNLRFTYLTGETEPHLINLISTSPDLSVPDDVVELEFRHNEEGDPRNYLVDGHASFDLAPYRIAGRDTVTFKVKIKQSDSETRIYDIVYKY